MIYPQTTAPLAVANPLFGMGIGLGVLQAADPLRPPSPLSASWLAWRDAVIAQFDAMVPLMRSTVYYFAQAGDDTTGNGSQALPYQTKAKAQTLMDGGSCTCLFNKGDTWIDLVGLVVRTGCSVGAYGSGARPKFYGWGNIQGAGGSLHWTLDSGTTYYSPDFYDVAWLRVNGSSQVFTRAVSVANCQATGFSFFWDSGSSRMYVNYSTRAHSLEAWEVCDGTASTYTHYLEGDDTRMEGIELDGWGMHSQAGVIQSYGLAHVGSNGDRGVIKDCKVTYTGYHAIGSISASSGQITLIRNCSVGYCRLGPGSDCKSIVFFSDSGNGQGVISGNTILAGNLWEDSVERRDQGIYGHTVTGTHAMVLVHNTTYTAGTMSSYSASGIANGPTATTVAQVRVFINKDYADYGSTTQLIVTPMPSNQIQIGCFYNAGCNGGQGLTTGGGNGAGWTINSYLKGHNPGYGCLFQAYTNSTGFIANSELYYDGYGAIAGPQGTNASAFAQLPVYNSFVVSYNPDVPTTHVYSESVPNFNNAGGYLSNNLYMVSADPVIGSAGTTGGTGGGFAGNGALGGTGKVVITSVVNLPADFAAPTDPLVYGGANATYRPEYDYNETRFTRQTIGPIAG